MHNEKGNLFFKLFLLVYASFLIAHIQEIQFESWHVVASLAGGIAVALAAHRNHGILPLFFLMGHIALEWYTHAIHGNHYTGNEMIFLGVHALLDAVFLYTEARQHYGKNILFFLVSFVACVVGIFLLNYTPPKEPINISPLLAQAMEIQKSIPHKHTGGVLHYLVLGGVLGCVMSHLISIPGKKNMTLGRIDQSLKPHVLRVVF